MPPEPIGVRIRTLRESKGLNSKQLAEAAGIHPSTMSQIEKGKRTPETRTIERVATALGKTAFQLMDGTALQAPQATAAKGPIGQPETLKLADISDVVSSAIDRAFDKFIVTIVAALGDRHAANVSAEMQSTKRRPARVPRTHR